MFLILTGYILVVVQTMRNSRKSSSAGEVRFSSILYAVLIIGLIIISIQYTGLSNRYRDLSDRHETLSDELEAATLEREAFKELEELVIQNPYTRFSHGLDIVSGYGLEYEETWHNSGHTHSIEGFSAVFYAHLDNLTLRMRPFIYFPLDDFAIPLTLQSGNAFFNESGVFVERNLLVTVWQSPVIWSVNATGKDAYDVQLPSKGWYTLSMVGPIRSTSGGGLSLRFIGVRLINGTWVREDRVHAWVEFKLMKGGEPVLFALSRHGRAIIP
jgi:hypothetical protein